MKKLFKALPVGVVSLIATLFVLYMSVASNPLNVKGLSLFAGADKIAHIIMYYFLALAYFFDYTNHVYPHHVKINILLALNAAAFVYGVLMEAAQGLLDMGRSMSISDGFANLIGVALALVSERLFWQRWYRKIMRPKHKHGHKNG